MDIQILVGYWFTVLSVHTFNSVSLSVLGVASFQLCIDVCTVYLYALVTVCRLNAKLHFIALVRTVCNDNIEFNVSVSSVIQ